MTRANVYHIVTTEGVEYWIVSKSLSVALTHLREEDGVKGDFKKVNMVIEDARVLK